MEQEATQAPSGMYQGPSTTRRTEDGLLCSRWEQGAPWWRRLFLRQTYHRSVLRPSEDSPLTLEVCTEFAVEQYVAKDTLRQEFA